MYNTPYLPEIFEQCRLEKTTLWHFPYDLNVHSGSNALFQNDGKNHEKAYYTQKGAIGITYVQPSSLFMRIHVYVHHFTIKIGLWQYKIYWHYEVSLDT